MTYPLSAVIIGGAELARAKNDLESKQFEIRLRRALSEYDASIPADYTLEQYREGLRKVTDEVLVSTPVLYRGRDIGRTRAYYEEAALSKYRERESKETADTIVRGYDKVGNEFLNSTLQGMVSKEEIPSKVKDLTSGLEKYIEPGKLDTYRSSLLSRAYTNYGLSLTPEAAAEFLKSPEAIKYIDASQYGKLKIGMDQKTAAAKAATLSGTYDFGKNIVRNDINSENAAIEQAMLKGVDPDAALALYGMVSTFKSYNLEGLQDLYKNTDPRKDPISAKLLRDRIEYLTDNMPKNPVLFAMESGLTFDGIINEEIRDFSPDKLIMRDRYARAVAAYYGVEVNRIFTPSEIMSLRNRLAEGGEAASLNLVKNIDGMSTDTRRLAYRELTNIDPTLPAKSFLSMGDVLPGDLVEKLTIAKAVKGNADKSMTVGIEATIRKYLGNTFDSAPELQDGMALLLSDYVLGTVSENYNNVRAGETLTEDMIIKYLNKGISFRIYNDGGQKVILPVGYGMPGFLSDGSIKQYNKMKSSADGYVIPRDSEGKMLKPKFINNEYVKTYGKFFSVGINEYAVGIRLKNKDGTDAGVYYLQNEDGSMKRFGLVGKYVYTPKGKPENIWKDVSLPPVTPSPIGNLTKNYSYTKQLKKDKP